MRLLTSKCTDKSGILAATGIVQRIDVARLEKERLRRVETSAPTVGSHTCNGAEKERYDGEEEHSRAKHHGKKQGRSFVKEGRRSKNCFSSPR